MQAAGIADDTNQRPVWTFWRVPALMDKVTCSRWPEYSLRTVPAGQSDKTAGDCFPAQRFQGSFPKSKYGSNLPGISRVFWNPSIRRFLRTSIISARLGISIAGCAYGCVLPGGEVYDFPTAATSVIAMPVFPTRPVRPMRFGRLKF